MIYNNNPFSLEPPPPKKLFSDFLSSLPTSPTPLSPPEPPPPQNILIQAIQELGRKSQKGAKAFQDAGTAQKEAWKKFLANPTAENSFDIVGDMALPLAGSIKAVPRGSLKFVPKFMREENVVDFAKAKEELGEFLRDRLIKGGRHPLEGQKQRIDFRHSTNRLFKDPVVEPSVASGGAGDQWQGQGFYITEEPKVADFYRSITGREIPPQFQFASGGGAINLNRLDNFISDLNDKAFSKHFSWLNELRRKLKEGTNPKFDEAPLGMKTIPEYITKRMKEIDALGDHPPKGESPFEYRNKRAALVRELRANLDYYNTMARDWQNNQRYGGMLKEVPSQRAAATYSGNFYANPDELFDLQLPLDQQPSSQRLLGALNEFNYGILRQPLGDYLAAAQQGTGNPQAVYDINESLVRHGKDVNPSVTQGPELPPFKWMKLPTNVQNALLDVEPNQRVSQTLDPWKVMEALRDKGIVGNKYLTRYAAEGLVPPSHNYVVTDPSRVRLNDVWAAFLAAGLPSLLSQQKKDDPKRTRSKGS